MTEACHLVARGGAAAHLPLDALLAAGIPILGLEPAGHRQAARFLARYADLPMDCADATLRVLAEALDITTVCTLDLSGFGVFRRSQGRCTHRAAPRPSRNGVKVVSSHGGG